MRKLTLFLALGLAATSAYGIGFGVGVTGGYSLSLEDEGGGAGFVGGKVLVGVMHELDVEIDLFYVICDPSDLLAYFGARHGFPVGPLTAFVNGGGSYPVFQEEGTVQGHNVEREADFGIWVGGGVEYPFNDTFAIDLNPRFNYVFAGEAYKYLDIAAGFNIYVM